jgi:hypothetical protein
MKRTLSSIVAMTTLALSGSAAAQMASDTIRTFNGDVPESGPDHFLVPFEVPEGTAEIEIRHDDLSEANILDWGLLDPARSRGWGGGNEDPAIVAERAASRSYVSGPIPPGTWHVVVGKAKIEELPARYHIQVVLRRVASLPDDPERREYSPSAALESAERWYAGDFHVHSRESGDARPGLDEVAAFARSRGLSFVLLSEHNTLSQLQLMNAAQERHPELLLLPGMEFTTYAGHANAIGATRWVDHKIGMPGVTIEGAVRAFHEQGALVSINHPTYELGALCIGCAWDHTLAASEVDAVEIASGGWDKAGQFFTESAIAFWDALCAQGAHVAPIGGSDDHRAGVALNAVQSPIGDPTTLVRAAELSVSGIVEGVRRGRTVVQLQGPADPMIELRAGAVWVGDTVQAARTTLRARITGGFGDTARFVVDGVPVAAVPIDRDPFDHELRLDAPEAGETRVRAEVLVDDKPRTVTGHIWLRQPDATRADPDVSGGGGCALRSSAAQSRLWPLLLCAALLRFAVQARRARPRREVRSSC